MHFLLFFSPQWKCNILHFHEAVDRPACSGQVAGIPLKSRFQRLTSSFIGIKANDFGDLRRGAHRTFPGCSFPSVGFFFRPVVSPLGMSVGECERMKKRMKPCVKSQASPYFTFSLAKVQLILRKDLCTTGRFVGLIPAWPGASGEEMEQLRGTDQ